ncbi:MAG: hypothetical protein IJ828_10530, partial [Treponema sp.]|nr:hypothetical protein [Treponema sp.]
MKDRRTIYAYSGIQRALAAAAAWAYILCLCPPAPAHEAVRLPSANAERMERSAPAWKSAEVISAEKGGMVRLGRASIAIPAGALECDTEISITRLDRVAEGDGTLRNATEGGGGYRFLPAGQKFKKEVFITIPYESAGTDLISTYYYDTKAGQWRALESVCLDRGGRLATCASTHFTDMMNATLAPPEAAGPLELNMNSIKGLEAADPLGGMIRMDSPKANAGGDASFSLPLQIPSGRRGMQPELAVAYSSGGGNGPMGKGFSLRCGSSITTDTRLGLPRYDGHDVYLKDGAELSLYDENGGEQEYTALSESAFEKVVRHDVSGGDWWEVTSKDGKQRLYGMRSSGKTDTASRSGYTKEGKFCTYSWNLTEEIDAYGNSASYYYDNDGGIPYIREIKYTGMNGIGGAYTVRLSYEARQDTILDARGRFLTSQSKRLSSIEALSGDVVLRKYEFGYAEGISGSSLLSTFTVRNGLGQSYTYRFDHHGLEKDGQGRNVYFADAVEWENGRPISEGAGFGSGITVSGSGGIGIGGKSLDAHVSGSVNASSSDGTGWTESTLADMDGDGLPDAVTQDGSVLSIYRNTGTGFEPSPVTVNAAAPHIDIEDSDTSGFGWTATGGVGAKASYIGADAKVSVAESNQNGTSEYTCMLCDADGDGRTDILITGRDTYLRNTGEGGSISFAPAKLNINGKIKNAQRTLTAKEKKGYGESLFEQTPFRAWKAPYSGIIYIEEKARRIDTESHTGSLYARTYVGDSIADEAELRLDLTKGGVQSSSGKKQVTQDGYAWLVLDTGGEPDGTDCEWEADIRYSSVQPFSLSSGLPVPAGQGNAGSLIDAGKFLPGRINEKQMKSLVSELTPIIKAKAASSTSQSQTVERFWQKLADLYTYDGTTHEFIIRNGVSRTEAENVLTEYFFGSVAEDIKKSSLEKLSVFGIKPEWKDGELSYMAEGSVSVSKD